MPNATLKPTPITPGSFRFGIRVGGGHAMLRSGATAEAGRRGGSAFVRWGALYFLRILNLTVQMATLVVAALLITTGCSKHKASALIEPNAGVDRVQKGMNKEEVQAAMGTPEKMDAKWWFYMHRGMIVAFGDNGVMFNIKCTSPFAGVTKEGIGIGSTRAELLAAYGSPSEEKHFQGFDDLWFAPLGINFDVENDRVVSFIVHLD